MKRIFNAIIGVALLATAGLLPAAPFVSEFTYQGRLNESGSPANNLYDFRFTLHSDAAASSPLALPVLAEDVPVTNGVFTVNLDFGPVFNGEMRWLQVEVRSGLSSGGYTLLSPRQSLTPAPHALFAKLAETAAAVQWTNIFGIGYGGSGTSNNVARSDHEHFGAAWTGSSTMEAGLSVYNASGTGLFGSANSFGGNGVAGRSLGAGGSGVAGFAFGAGPEKNGVYGYALTGGNGVQGASDDGTGVLGRTVNSVGVRGVANSPGNSGVGVEGRHEGNGWGVLGTSGGGFGVYGTSDTSAGVSGNGLTGVVGLSGHPFGIGVAGTSASGTGVSGHSDIGTGVSGQSTSGIGLRGEVNTGFGAQGSASGALGRGVQGNATGDSGIGVGGYASRVNGIGVYAEGAQPAGTALAVSNGGIRVLGAGRNTSTAAFIHRVSTTGPSSAIDHPLINGREDAMIFVTHRSAGDPPVGFSKTVGVFLFTDTPNAQWRIAAQDGSAIPANTEFNVLIVTP